ncbi:MULTISPECIES: YczE/YyaS/YitT family protein [Bacillaceae]|uniref:YczE/YyaS/YitT family protein n=1 Tax=Bacillaceae TaxID=186817 RepID=UPI00101D8C4F|nr:membrane protein [Ectobacillus funiculus]
MKLTRLLFFIMGIAILTFGASLTLKANLGAGPWDALTAGQATVTGFTVGSWVIIDGVVLLFVNAYLLRQKPQFLAAVTFVFIGTMIDFWLLKVMKDWHPIGLAYQAGTLLVGIIMLSVGVAMYLQSSYPANPIDNLMIALHKRFGVSLMVAKTLGEMTALVFAILLKGPIGIGTLVIAFTIGPTVQWCYHPTERFMLKVSSILR